MREALKDKEHAASRYQISPSDRGWDVPGAAYQWK
jgi:hypothetical protein